MNRLREQFEQFRDDLRVDLLLYAALLLYAVLYVAAKVA